MDNAKRVGFLTSCFVSILCLISDSAAADKTLIKAGTVHTMTGPPLMPGAVLVSDGKIVRVAADITAPEGATVIDMKDGVLIPGLVEAYSQAGLEGGTSEQSLEVSPQMKVSTSINWRSRLFRELLDEGVTTVTCSPGRDNVVAGLACSLKTAGSREKRILNDKTALVITVSSDPTSGNRSRSRPDSIFVRQPTNRMGVIWMLRNTFHKAGSGQIPDSILGDALDGKIRLLAHSRTHFDISALLTLSREFGLKPIVVGGTEAYKVAPQLAENKTAVIMGPLTTGAITGAERTELFWNQAQLLDKYGVEFSFSGGRLLDQARFAVRFGLDKSKAMEAITAAPARLLGLENRIGTLAQGLDADLVGLSGDPLEFTTSVNLVMIDGNIYKQGN